ncbi:MAG: flagellar basal body P-ring formation chaperone FlgA [Candidatus Paracaedibacteraceae bacterium]|nr:flagellar basal body P-ring formation chaperone FlgA [Candidatus Paracaedibacteraceae bacterium]
MKTLLISTLLIAQGWTAPAPFSALDVANALKTHLQDKVNFSGDFNVNLVTNKLSIPHEADEDTLILEEVHFAPDQKNFQAILAIANGDKRIRLKGISGKIDPLSDIPILARAIAPGDIIEASDITWNKLPTTRLSQNFILKAEDLIGQTAKNRILQPGQPLNRHDIRAPIVVKRGDTVTIAYKSNSMMLTTTAIAEKDAARGEMARFKTMDSNKIIQARVVDFQKAEIKPVEF